MAIRDIAPWKWGRKSIPARREGEHPIYSLHRAMDQLFDQFFGDFERFPFGTPEGWTGLFSPQVNMAESDKDIRITAELPGMDEKDIEISTSKDTLTIRGEKKEEKEEEEKDYYYAERSFGTFRRVISLPCEVDTENVDASFKRGVLTVTLSKMAPSEAEVKKIPIKTD